MICTVEVELNAAHPELPLNEASTFVGSPSAVFVKKVPRSVGNWKLTKVYVSFAYPDNSLVTAEAVATGGVWVATLSACDTSGRTLNGFQISADGIDENGNAVEGYVLGIGDLSVCNRDRTVAPGVTAYNLRYFDTAPTSPKKGDVAPNANGDQLYYNGSSWVPFANVANKADLVDGKVPSSQLPSYVDDVLEFASLSAFPATGESGKIYVALDTNRTYRWSGTQYTEIANPAFDDAVTPTSANGVKSSGIWAAIWGALSALPTGFTSLYDWCVAKLRDKLDLDVYGYGNPVVSFADGFSVSYGEGSVEQRYTAPSGGETIIFVGPVPSSNPFFPNYKYYYPSSLGTLDSFDPDNYSVWCLVCDNDSTIPGYMMYKTGPYYYIGSFNSGTPTLTLGTGEATGDAPTMARPIGATSDTLAKASQLAGKASIADATLTPIYSQTPTFSSWQFRASSGISLLEPSVSYSSGTWTFYMSDEAMATCEGDWDAVSLEFNLTSYVVTATRTRTDIIGYVLGSQSDKPLASETEAEALRTAVAGKQDALSQTQLDNIAAVPNKADASALPYALVTKTISNNAVTLDDRAINAVAVSSSLASLTVNFPTATSGKVRDFGLRLTVASGVTTAPQLVLPQGVTCENADGEAPEIGADGAATILYFTETASGVFLVKGEVVTAIS